MFNLKRKIKTLWQKSSLTNAYHPQSPLNPWAFIRVCNEAMTLRQSLDSIIGAISRGVIVYNECTDGSEKIIKDFCLKHQGFKAIPYPYQVSSCKCSRVEFENKRTLADYYNFALSFIPQGEWIVKIDGDQIYDYKKLKESFFLATSPQDIVFYFRLNLHCFDDRIFLDKKNPISDPKDHWLLCNQDLFFINDIQEEDGLDISYWELLQIPFAYNGIDAPLNTWHFPLLKESRRALAKKENHIPLDKCKKIIPSQYLSKIKSDMLDEQRILRYLKGEF